MLKPNRLDRLFGSDGLKLNRLNRLIWPGDSRLHKPNQPNRLKRPGVAD